jgi:hypothetical protein
LTTTALRPGQTSEQTVEAMPVGKILSAEERSTARLIKVDVEGAEDNVLAGIEPLLGTLPRDLEIFVELSPQWWADSTKRPIDVLKPFLDAGLKPYEVDNNYWPWRYLWPFDVKRPRRCTRDLRERVRRLDLILSPLDRDEL